MKSVVHFLILTISFHAFGADLFNGEYRQTMKVVDYQNYTEDLCRAAGHLWNANDCFEDGYQSVTISKIEDATNIYYAEIFSIDERAGFCNLHIELTPSANQLNYKKDDCSLSLMKDASGLLQLNSSNCDAVAECSGKASVSGSFKKVYDRPSIPRSSEL